MKTKSIAYSDLVPVLTKAIQEQQAEIEALKAQNAMLTGKVTELDQLKAEVENLKKSLGLGTQLSDNK
jgi:cell shape-determining protein MreC